MHTCLFVRPSHGSELAQLAEISSRRSVVGAVAAPARLLESLPRDTLEQLASSDIEWVRSARTAPSLTLLPDDFVQSAIAVEADRYSELGLTGAAFYFEGPPGSRLPRIANAAAVSCLITTTPEPRSGVLVNLDMITPCFGATSHIDTDEVGDGLSVWLTGVDEIEQRIERLSNRPGSDLTSPTRYLEDHRVAGSFRTDDLTAEPDPLLSRKVVRIATRLPARPGLKIVNLLLDAAAVAEIDAHAGRTSHESVQRSIIQARARIDSSRRRADDWARVSRLDWDADGHEEVQVELKSTSVVLDPSRGGEVLVFDDKAAGTTISWLEGEAPGMIVHMRDTHGDSDTMEMSVDGVEERRDGVSIALSDGDGRLSVTVSVSDRALDLEYRVTAPLHRRLGPELPMSIGKTSIRVDGGEWTDVDRSIARSGHRFRLRGDSAEILITSLLPTDLFARPGDGGVVIWPNWPTTSEGDFPLRIEVSTSEG